MDDAATTARPTVVYGNDVLCGWCFATGPAILEAKQTLGDGVSWRIETGGLVVGERVRPVAQDREYLVAGLAQVAMVTGRRAGEAYYERVLRAGEWVSDSEPACRAVLVAQDMAPEAAVEFSHWLTDALYLDGRVPDDPDTLRDAAAAHGLDGDELLARWATPGAVEATRRAFQRARALGVHTYPSLFLDGGAGALVPLVTGYADARTIVGTVREAVARPTELPR
ncbi:MAG: DsbA family protein [Kineosporiaceae bacterium]